jgi:hypothetical protein
MASTYATATTLAVDLIARLNERIKALEILVRQANMMGGSTKNQGWETNPNPM